MILRLHFSVSPWKRKMAVFGVNSDRPKLAEKNILS